MRPHFTGAASLVLVITTFSSLVSMISILKIDQIVHGELYDYGLHFNYQWAVPYWTMTTIVFGMSWFNIIASIAFQFYVLIYGRKEALEPTEMPTEPTPTLQPTKAEIIEVETKPTEKVEECREEATEPAEQVEKELEETQETQTVVEATPQPEQTETTQAKETEGQKEQESKPAEESKTETQETSTTGTETEQETPEKSEETQTPVGVPEEEPQTTTEETSSQVGTSPL
jgi:cell division protein FtsN